MSHKKRTEPLRYTPVPASSMQRPAFVTAMLILLVGLLGSAILPSGWMSDKLRPLEVASVIATGAIIYWYTEETRRLRLVGERQLLHAEAQVRGTVRPLFELDALGGLLRLRNIGLGPALEVVIEVDPMPGELLGESGFWSSEFERLPSILPGQEKVPRWWSTQETPNRGKMMIDQTFMRAVNKLPNAATLAVRASYRDSYLCRHRAYFTFRSGDLSAYLDRIEEEVSGEFT